MHLVFDFKPPKTQVNWSLLAKNMVNGLKFLVLVHTSSNLLAMIQMIAIFSTFSKIVQIGMLQLLHLVIAFLTFDLFCFFGRLNHMEMYNFLAIQFFTSTDYLLFTWSKLSGMFFYNINEHMSVNCLFTKHLFTSSCHLCYQKETSNKVRVFSFG